MESVERFDWLIFIVGTFLAYTLVKHFLAFPAPLAWRILVPILALPIFFALRREYAWYVEGALWALGIVLGLLGSGLHKAMQSAEQDSIDKRAADVLTAVRSGKGATPPRFSLYLRSFQLTRRLTTQDMDRHMSGSPPTHIDFETVLRDALKPIAPMLAIGASDIDSGAAKLHASEERWRSDFCDLANAAVVVLLVPGDTPGTTWETEWILDNQHLSKCIFVMPMSPTTRLSYAPSWNKVRAALQAVGLELPAYDERGALLRFDDSRRLVASVELPKTIVTVQKLRSAVEEALP
jgi:hypothetical protein